MAPRKGTAQGQIAADWKAIYSTPEGRRALAQLFKSIGVYDEFPGADGDAFRAGIIVGERNVAARIAKWIGMSAETYVEDEGDQTHIVDRIIQQYSNRERI
jgi:hypothetical protein